MGVKTTAYANLMANLVGGSGWPAWSAEVSLLTAVADPLAGSVTEATYTSYARQAFPTSFPNQSTLRNQGAITFPTCTGGGPQTIVALGIHNLSGGALYYVVYLDTPVTVDTGVTPTIQAYDFTLIEYNNVAKTNALAALMAGYLGGGYVPTYGPVAVGLLTGVTSVPSATATETTYTSYARQTMTASAAASGIVVNANALTFPACTGGGPQTITHVGFYAATGPYAGILYYVLPLAVPRIVDTGITPQIPIDGLSLTEA